MELIKSTAVFGQKTSVFCSDASVDEHIYDGDGKGWLYKDLFSLICQKDRYTGWHCKNVAQLSYEIGKAAGMPEENLRLLYTAGLLHDIGKLMVDSSILLKPGKLTDAEFLKIQSHPWAGVKILETFDADKTIIDGAWHHHEKWDGSGYPDGLKKNGVQTPTRIITIADSFDAMTEYRPYRDPMPFDKVKKEFIKCNGKQFDPIFCTLFIDMIADFNDSGKIYKYEEVRAAYEARRKARDNVEESRKGVRT